MKLNKLLIAVASVALLTGCANAGDVGQDGNTNNNGGSDATATVPGGNEGGSDSGSTILPPTAEAYKITLVNTVEGVTLTSDKDKAKVGDLVNITINITDDAYAVSKVKCNKTSMTKVDDTHYKFLMPDEPVKISYEVIVVKGDVIIQGEISRPFEKEGNIYVARNVKVKEDSRFNVIVRGENKAEKELSVVDVDRYKTFANIGLGSGGYDFQIGGRATYDFFYDPANGSQPLYVKRVKIDVLPSTANEFYDLFEGSIRSGSSVMPEKLATMDYYNANAKQKIAWKRYSDNSSLANVSTRDIEGNYNDQYIVYSKLENDRLTVVDNFTPGAITGYSNAELSSDTKEYSGIYKLGESDNYGSETNNNEFVYTNSYVHPSTAQAVVDGSPIDMQTYENDIMYGYRVGFIVEGSTTQADVSVISWPDRENGGFVVHVESSKTINTDNDPHNQGNPEHSHYEYRIESKFTDDGALLTSTYEEKLFGSDKYNFTNNTWKSGDAETNFKRYGTLTNKYTIAYTYGEAANNDVNLDVSEYFVNQLTSFTIVNPDCDLASANKLLLGDNAFDFVDVKFAPATALNAYQYQLTDSSNATVIKPISNRSFIASFPGKTNVKCGIPNGFGFSDEIEVEVSGKTRPVRSFYLETRRIYQNCTASGADIYTGQRNEFGLSASQNLRLFPTDTKAEFVGESLGFKVSVDWAKQTLVLDGSEAVYTEAGTTIQVKILTDSYDSKWTNSQPSVFTFTILKGIPSDALIGTWTSKEEMYKGHFIKFTNEASGDENYPYKGYIHAGSEIGDFEFNYSFDNSKNEIKATIVPTHLTNGEFDSSELVFEYQSKTGRLGVYFLSRYTTSTNEVKIIEVYGWQSSSDSLDLDLFDKVN